MAEDLNQQPFRLIKSQRGGNKLLERGYIYGMQRRAGDVTHWLCEQRGICKARVHTKGMEVVKRTNEHTHAPNEQDESCCETKAEIKRRARESQDSSHHIVSESVQIISGGHCYQATKAGQWPTRRKLFTRGCGSRFAYYVPFLFGSELNLN